MQLDICINNKHKKSMRVKNSTGYFHRKKDEKIPLRTQATFLKGKKNGCFQGRPAHWILRDHVYRFKQKKKITSIPWGGHE